MLGVLVSAKNAWRWVVSPVLSISGLLGLFGMPQDVQSWLNRTGWEGLWVLGNLFLIIVGLVLLLDRCGVLGNARPAKG